MRPVFKKNIQARRSPGMTLVELLIVLVIAGILTGLAVPNFISWFSRYRLSAAARDLKSNYLSCKMRAVKDNCDCVLQFNTAGGNYTMTSACGRSITETMNLLTEYKGDITFGLPAGVNPPVGLGAVDDGVSFGGNQVAFQSNGRPNGMGTVYLQNAAQGTAYAVSLGIAGNITVRRWHNGQWEEQ